MVPDSPTKLRYPAQKVAAEPLPASDRKVAEMLAQMNHRTRNVYWSARRHGKSEDEALGAAWESLPR